MAPVTRSSVHGRPSTRSQSQVFHEDSDIMDGQTSPYDDDAPLDADLDNASPFRSAQDMLLPLQETANRVSRQVEDFAKSLDKFKSERDVSDQELWAEAVELVSRYTQVTDSRIKQAVAKSRTSHEEEEHQLSTLRQEANLWTLMQNLLLCKCPDAVQSAQEVLEQRMASLHRYSTDFELWEHFLDADLVGQEYEIILDWLQETAAQTLPPLEDVVAELTAKSDRGDGIWSAGLIFTKDAIKKQKRSRAWPMPLDPSNPGLRTTHFREDDDEPLVTQMDPDGPTREQAKLIKLDEYHEEAAWRICWEMLRRGMKLEDIESWWSDRNESWRTALIQGTSKQNDQRVDSPWLRIMNLASNSEYFARCRSISEKNLLRSDYEEAVYGVISGNHPATMMACESMDDMLYSYFNAVLIERYKQFVSAYQRKVQDPGSTSFQPAASSFSVVREFLSAAEIQDDVKEDFHKPHNFVEAAIVSQDFEHFFIQQGHSTAQIAHIAGQSPQLMEKDTSSVHNDCARIAAQDQDAVRIIAHLQLLLRRLGFLNDAYREHPYQMDNNIVNYIGFLERDSKFSLLPLYAAQLSADRVPHVLGTILIKVTDSRERQNQVKLMKAYGIDVPLVLLGIFQLANYHDLERFKKVRDARLATKVTHYVETGNTKAVKIKADFMGEEPSALEEKSIMSAEWMRYMDVKSWGMAVWAVSTLYKMFLLTGKLSAARHLTQRVNLADISLTATSMNLSLATGIEDDSDDGDVDMGNSAESIEGRVQPVSPTKRRQQRDFNSHPLAKQTTNREELASQSLVWAQLEQLVGALWALERWQAFADDIEDIRGNLTHMRTAKRELQAALNDLTNAMNPVLQPDFLMLPIDDTEKSVLSLIRTHYIPEIILGYNSALYFAGHSLTRQCLVECMNLAQEVARNEMLTSAFVDSGRMRELVMAFALDSQALLRANEVGGGSIKTKKGKWETRGVEGKADIWQVTWKEQKESDLETTD